jgi:hypothetical protein
MSLVYCCGVCEHNLPSPENKSPWGWCMTKTPVREEMVDCDDAGGFKAHIDNTGLRVTEMMVCEQFELIQLRVRRRQDSD